MGAIDVAGLGPETGNNSSPGLSNNSAAPQSSGGGMPWGPIIGAGGAIGSGIMNYFAGQSANDANSAEAAANRAFAAQEAETSRQYDQAKTVWQATHGYQNAVDDMRKAGLNPAMMYAKSMSPESGSGGGGSAASAPGNPIHTNALAPALNSAIQSMSLMNDLRNTDADILVKHASALNQAAQTEQSTWGARLTEEQIEQQKWKTAAAPELSRADVSEAKARENRARLDLENEARERILNQIGTGVNAFTSATGGVGNILKNITRPDLNGIYNEGFKRGARIGTPQ